MSKQNLLVISDLHLGEGIGLQQPDEITERVDGELRAFLHHYTVYRRDDRPWRLVINGDMVDFVGMCLPPGAFDVGTEHDEVGYGLGAREYAAVLKLEQVIARHGGVFRALGAFLCAGNEIAVVTGNHDAEFHFGAVQALFREAVLRSVDEREALVDAIQFHPWFFFEEGMAWIEHGHQYDHYCAFDEVLEPADSASELDLSVGSAIVRYLMNRFRNVADNWGDEKGFFDHLNWARQQGGWKFLAILRDYGAMCRALVRKWAARSPAALAARRLRARGRLGAIAGRFRLREELLDRVRGMWRVPVHSELGRLVRGVMLDRLFLLVSTPVLLIGPFVAVPTSWLPLVFIAVALVLAAVAKEAVRARDPVDPRLAMRRASDWIRRQARVPVVVMGHSHDATAENDESGWYFNSGTWAPHGIAEPFTHVVIERTADGVRGQLLRWSEGASRALDGARRPRG